MSLPKQAILFTFFQRWLIFSQPSNKVTHENLPSYENKNMDLILFLKSRHCLKEGCLKTAWCEKTNWRPKVWVKWWRVCEATKSVTVGWREGGQRSKCELSHLRRIFLIFFCLFTFIFMCIGVLTALYAYVLRVCLVLIETWNMMLNVPELPIPIFQGVIDIRCHYVDSGNWTYVCGRAASTLKHRAISLALLLPPLVTSVPLVLLFLYFCSLSPFLELPILSPPLLKYHDDRSVLSPWVTVC